MANRATTWIGLGAAGAVGYYFYQAGGDPKVAEKKFEADAAKVSATLKDQVPGQAKKLQKEGELTLENAKSSLSSLGKDLKSEANKVDAKVSKLSSDAASKLDQTGRDVHAAGSKAVNEFDKNVNEGTAKAKSGLSSWFGSK